MRKVLAFDVYGTLIDTHGILTMLEEFVGNNALQFSNTWRAKQLEYSFRKGLMNCYEPFSVCTLQALNYCCDSLGSTLSLDQKNALMKSYTQLPAFTDVPKALCELNDNFSLVAFSNGETDAIEHLLKNAKIRKYFSEVISADEVKTFKPSPVIYQHLLSRMGSTPENTWLVSSNPFDVIGAKSQKLNSAWVKRSKLNVNDPWGIEPDLTISKLGELNQSLIS